MVKNRIKYGLVIFIMLVLCLFYYNFPFLIMFVTVLIMPVFSIIAAKKAFNKLDIVIETDKKIIGKSKEASIILKAVNGSFFPILNINVELYIKNDFYADKEEYYVNMPARINSSEEVKLGISSIYAGNVSAVITGVYMTDVLGVVEYKKDIKKSIIIKVMPQMVEMDYKKDNNNSDNKDIESGIAVGEDTSEILDFRKYIAGDRLQRIHWKLTVKHEELIVKEYPQVFDNDLFVLVELNNSSKVILDTIIDTTFTLSYQLLEEQEKFKVCWLNISMNELLEMKIENEEDIFQVMSDIFATKTYSNNYQAQTKYDELYGDDDNKRALCIMASDNREHEPDAVYIKNKAVIKCI